MLVSEILNTEISPLTINDTVSITVIATGFDDVTSLEQIKENFLASTTETTSPAQNETSTLQETVATDTEEITITENLQNDNHEQATDNDFQAAEAIAGAPSFSQVHHTEQPAQQAQATEKKEAPKVPLSDETEFNLDVPSFLRDLT